MDLILWRHAEAELLREGQDDLDRGLTPRGEQQAKRMAKWIDQRLAQTARVLVSPAARAQQTAQALDRRYKTLPGLAPGDSAESLLRAARWPGDSGPVLVVGHQPTLGLVISQLLCGQEQEWSVKRGAVWWLRQRERDGAAQVVVQAVMAPDCL